MKLRNQALIVISMTSALFLAMTYFEPIRLSLLKFIPVTLCFSTLAFLFIKELILNRIVNINKQITSINTQEEKNQRISIEGFDEISSIGININALLDTIAENQRNLERRVDERTHELQKHNQDLKNEISEHISATRKPRENTECLSQINRYDNLTSLPNRILFNEILTKSLSQAKRNNQLLAVLLIDLDSLKTINPPLEVEKTNFVFKEIGRRFANVLRTEDILAKLDGDEFVILLNDIKKSKFASTVAAKLLQVCSHTMKIDSHEFSITASIGICVYPSDGNSLEEILNNADSALFKAKSTGGNNYQYYTHEMDVEAREYLELESALRKAIHSNGLALHYQPKLSIRKGTIAGVEALMRWEHPTLGIIPPARFIPLAEESGLIMKLGEWAIREACRTAKFWQDEGYEHITVSLNLSARQFHHPEIAKIIANALKITGLDPRYLELEISETTVMHNIELATSILDNIHSTGAQISLDHFGTGYTSISALKHFPISALKIDQTFIKGVPSIPNDMAITSALIDLAHNLGFDIVAQGVETPEQVQFLANQNCDMVQGYYLGHPQSAQKIVVQFRKLMEEVMF